MQEVSVVRRYLNRKDAGLPGWQVSSELDGGRRRILLRYAQQSLPENLDDTVCKLDLKSLMSGRQIDGPFLKNLG